MTSTGPGDAPFFDKRSVDVDRSFIIDYHRKLDAFAVGENPIEQRTLGPPLENNPKTPPSSRDEGLRLLHGLETNLATSLQTPQEA